MNKNEYSKIMAANGRKGGLKRGENLAIIYEPLISKIKVMYATTTLTQKEIAEYLGCSVGYVNKYSPSKIKPDFNKLNADKNFINEVEKVAKERELNLKLMLVDEELKRLKSMHNIEPERNHIRKKI